MTPTSAAVIVSLVLSAVVCQTDRTRQAWTHGADVVEAVVEVLRETRIFSDHWSFIRRLAYVASQDGSNPETYPHGSGGGIWQVDESVFSFTQSHLQNEMSERIKRKLGIDWSKATYADLRMPLYSGLAYALYFRLQEARDNIPADNRKQDVQLICLEGGIQRECRIEDLLASKFGSSIIPDHGSIASNPCAVPIPGLHIDRFPHPTDKGKFILCDSKGQGYLVLCPLNEVFNGITNECERFLPMTSERTTETTVRATATSPTVGTTLLDLLTSEKTPIMSTTTQSTPSASTVSEHRSTSPIPTHSPVLDELCTEDSLAEGVFFHPYSQDTHRYIHCNGNYSATLKTCDHKKVWRQASGKCLLEYVNDKDGNAVHGLMNPCLMFTPGFYPHPVLNTSYIQCSMFGEGYLKKCQSGFEYLPVGQKCGQPAI